jgi:carboxyl-terminal processing protease
MMVGYKMNDKQENSLISISDYPVDSLMRTGRIEEIIRFVENKYVDSVQSSSLIEAALNAVVSGLDPHSVYLSPAELEDVSDQMEGSYQGVGIDNIVIDDTVNIRSVIEDSPASKAGLQSFDKIIAINGLKVAGQSLDYSVIRSMLRKKSGEEVILEVLRAKSPLLFKINISEVKVRSVHSYLLPEIQTVVVKIDRFGTNTYKEFMEDIEKYFGQNKANHLILDLRDNPGGFLPEATNILCQIFAEKDRLLLYTQGRNAKKNEYKSTGKRFFNINHVNVLIDENSASASEIVAGAIQDWDRGLIIGRRSYGKGLVQEQYNLTNGGAMRLTVARYYTPSGRSIQRDYHDRDHYEGDFADRHHNGDLFNKDSTVIKNGGKYLTQILKRNVSGSGGVTPDIFVSMDTVYKDHTMFEVSAMIPEFSYRYVYKHKNTIPPDLKKIIEWKLPIEFYSEFMAFINKHSDKGNVKNSQELKSFENECKLEIVRILFNKTDFDQYLSSHDQFIIAAVKAIQNKTKPEDLK